VLTYLRWLHYLVEVRHAGRRVIFVNMDETGMNTHKFPLKGSLLTKRRASGHGEGSKGKRIVKATLLAAICNDPELQRLLPQVLLPRRTYERGIPPATRRKWATACAAPLQTWMNSKGWNDVKIMSKWLQLLRTVVSEYDAQAALVLVMDCSPVHINKTILELCRALHISVLPVPGQATWYLQACDVYVFGPLKLYFRNRLLRLLLQRGRVSPMEQDMLECFGDSIRQKIVDKDWRPALSSVGLPFNLINLRPAILALLGEGDILPLVPSEPALHRFLGRAHQAARVPWRELFFPELHPPVPPPPPPPEEVPVMVVMMEPAAIPQEVPEEAGSASQGPPILRAVALPRAPPGIVDAHAALAREGPSAGTRACVRALSSSHLS
jgi:hypothetical protein